MIIFFFFCFSLTGGGCSTIKGHFHSCVGDFKGWWERRRRYEEAQRSTNTDTHAHTHAQTCARRLPLREKGQYPEEEMVSHCYDWSHDKVRGGRSVTFIVKLIIPQKKIPRPAPPLPPLSSPAFPTSSVLSCSAVAWRKKKPTHCVRSSKAFTASDDDAYGDQRHRKQTERSSGAGEQGEHRPTEQLRTRNILEI